MELTPDHSRRLEQLVRTGTVYAVDYSNANAPRVRVQSGGLKTDWLSVANGRCGAVQEWNPLTVGEQVAFISASGETANGIIIGSIPSDAKPVPSTDPEARVIRYPDGATISYHSGTGTLTASGVKSAHIQAADTCVIDCPEVTATGNLTLQGNLTVQGETQVQSLQVAGESQFQGLAAFLGGTEGDRV